MGRLAKPIRWMWSRPGTVPWRAKVSLADSALCQVRQKSRSGTAPEQGKIRKFAKAGIFGTVRIRGTMATSSSWFASLVGPTCRKHKSDSPRPNREDVVPVAL